MTKRLSYLLLLAVALNSQLQIQAEEPASEFLQELRNQRYYELAEYYLDVQVDKGMLSDEFRAKMDMDRAMVILRGARNVGNVQNAISLLKPKYFWNDFRRRPKIQISRFRPTTNLGIYFISVPNWWNLKGARKKMCPAKPSLLFKRGSF